jgi:hypothetical protein
MKIRRSLRSFKPIYKAYTVYKYLLFQYELLLAMFRDWKDRQNPAYVLVPPPRLRHRVHGNLDKQSYLQVGRTVAQDIRNLCKMVGRDLYSFEHILDFGSGCGRVIQNFQNAPISCHLYATDIDSDLVSRGKNNYIIFIGVQIDTDLRCLLKPILLI